MQKDDLEYEWQETPLTYGKLPTIEFKQSFLPRLTPHNLLAIFGNEIYEMDPVEYLIGYSNRFIAIGMIKHEKDVGHRVSLF